MTDPREQRRLDWIELLEGVVHYHLVKANKTAPVLYMQEPSEEHIMHKVYMEAVKEAVALINMLPRVDEDGVLPQYGEGPLG